MQHCTEGCNLSSLFFTGDASTSVSTKVNCNNNNNNNNNDYNNNNNNHHHHHHHHHHADDDGLFKRTKQSGSYC